MKSVSEIYRLYPIKKLVYDYKNYLENKILQSKICIEEALYETDFNIDNLENEFIPSKISINSLNFITKSEEEKIRKIKIEDEKIIKITKIIYVLIGEKYEDISQENLIENLYGNIFPKINIDSMSKIYI